jgi:hypothetical protein
MAVTDDHVAALRTQLSGNSQEFERIFAGLDPEGVRTGYRTLVSAAFCLAVERRFGRQTTTAEVIEFVGDVRSRSDHVAAQLDPKVAERVIRGVYVDDSFDDLDAKTSWEAQMILLAAMTANAQYDATGLDAFLSEARKVADQWLA